MTEQRIIEGCKKGDSISQQLIFDSHADSMLLLCMRYVRSLPDAEEMMLNGFYKFYKSIATFDYKGDGSVRAWIKKIMVNECLMQLRKKNKLQIADEKSEEEISINETAISKLSAEDIFKLVMTLPTGYRTVFNLFAIEGYEHKEIAKMLGITEGTSKSQLNKARGLLQKAIQKQAML